MVQTRQGERRLSAPIYRLLLSAHLILAVGWLGVAVAKLALGIAAARAGQPDIQAVLYAAISVVDRVFPPAAIGTLVTGVLLSLGTKWGLIQHYWIVVKLVLTVAVPVTAVQFGDRLIQPALATASRPAPADGQLLTLAAGSGLLIALAVAHLLMLGAATVISVYKPWGKTPFGRRAAARLTVGSAVTAGAGAARPG